MLVMPKGVKPRGGQGLVFSVTLHSSGLHSALTVALTVTVVLAKHTLDSIH